MASKDWAGAISQSCCISQRQERCRLSERNQDIPHRFSPFRAASDHESSRFSGPYSPLASSRASGVLTVWLKHQPGGVERALWGVCRVRSGAPRVGVCCYVLLFFRVGLAVTLGLGVVAGLVWVGSLAGWIVATMAVM